MSMVHTKFASRFLFLLAALFFSAGAALGQSMDYAIEHVMVINPGGNPQPDKTISGHTITTIVLSEDFKPTASVRLIDGHSKFVIPGLSDMHMHFRDAGRDLKMDVANGVLGLRNMGGVAIEVFPLRYEIAQDKEVGPKIVACGSIYGCPRLIRGLHGNGKLWIGP